MPGRIDGDDLDNDIYGSDEAEQIYGHGGFDDLYGYGGNDILDGGTGGDALDGGDGNDILSGGTGFDRLRGGAGNDSISGGDADDYLYGGAGTDTLSGGAGTDTVWYQESDAAVTVTLGGTGSGGDAQGDLIADDIEDVFGSYYADILTGNGASNMLWGMDGNDTLSGGSGNDRLIGGAGGDTLSGGDGEDTISYEGTLIGVIVTIGGPTWSGEAQGDTVANDIENVVGSQGADRLTGNVGDNDLYGGDGYDILRGEAGADRLDGGNDVDLVTYWGSAIAVTVDLGTGAAGGGAAGDVFISIENVSGGMAGDTLTGDFRNNGLNGYEGDDVLLGGIGTDTLTGGTGADRFIYTASFESSVGAADRITDFSHAQGDKIDLSLIDANNGAAGDQAFTFIGTGLYTGVAGQLRYASDGAVTTIAGDINGDAKSDFHIQLAGAIGLVAGDFVL
jgi:Ca2+-binding RTX toxin-like protein